MRLLSQEELGAIQFKSNKLKSSKIGHYLKDLALLQENDSVLIEKSEWPIKNNPGVFNNTAYRKRAGLVGYRLAVRTLANNEGWVLTKLKK